MIRSWPLSAIALAVSTTTLPCFPHVIWFVDNALLVYGFCRCLGDYFWSGLTHVIPTLHRRNLITLTDETLRFVAFIWKHTTNKN